MYVPGDVRGRTTTVRRSWACPRGTRTCPSTVDKRTVADLGDWPYPKHPLAPLTEVVHDRLSVEVFRGCTRGCRFCQAGMITRPVRERPAEQVRTMIANGLRQHGLRRGQPDVAVHRRLQRRRAGVVSAVNAPGCPPSKMVSVSPAVAAGRRLHRWSGRPRWPGPGAAG
ncbi:MAG: hypothetical protein V9E89_00965 [Ilumatobacteraceae bacterium]